MYYAYAQSKSNPLAFAFGIPLNFIIFVLYSKSTIEMCVILLFYNRFPLTFTLFFAHFRWAAHFFLFVLRRMGLDVRLYGFHFLFPFLHFAEKYDKQRTLKENILCEVRGGSDFK